MEKRIQFHVPHIQQRLDEILQYPLTVVQAPSGYGKTTAVRHFLKDRESVPAYWWHAAEDALISSWRGLAGVIGKIDRTAGEKLLELGYPDPANSWDIAQTFREVKGERECFLILDDFQWLQKALPQSVLSGLLSWQGERLHIIIITQTSYSLPFSLLKSHILFISAEDLRLDEGDILSYCRISGVCANQEQVKQIYRYTEGWIVAVILAVRQFKKEGTLSLDLSVVQMMERIVWDSLDEKDRDILLHFARFSEVSLEQAAFLLGFSTLPESVVSLLRDTPFIRYDAVADVYSLHALLREMLARRLSMLEIAQRRRYEVQAGKWYARLEDQARALECFWAARSFADALALPYQDMTLHEICGMCFVDFAEKLLSKAPAEIKKQHLVSLLRIAFAFAGGGPTEQFLSLMREISGYIDELADGLERQAMRSEWSIVYAYRHFPDICAIAPELEKAAANLGGRSCVLTSGESFLFVEHDLMNLHLKDGLLNEELRAMARIGVCCEKLTGKRYCADEVFRAQIAFYRADLAEAERLCHTASYLLADTGWWRLKMSVQHLLGRIRYKRGEKGFVDTLSHELNTISGDDMDKRKIADLIWTDCFMWVGLNNLVPAWVKNQNTLGVIQSKYGLVYIQIALLFQQQEYMKMLGTAEAVVKQREQMPLHLEAYIRILVAVVYLGSGHRDTALAHMTEAVRLCAADGLFMPVIEFAVAARELIPEALAANHARLPADVLKEGESYYDNAALLIRLLSGGAAAGDLTARETEVAGLVAKGKTNKEIAAELYISETTVRAHLRTIFSKLGIDRRGKISEKLKKD